MSFQEIEAAIRDIAEGKMVIVVDEEDRENEGDLTMAAEKVTPEAINFMATYGRGLICMPMTSERLDALKIPLMVAENQSVHGTAFCISVEARRNVSTGISAADRAVTILTSIDPATRPEDLIRPGHVFPLRAKPGGVLERAGQTEAAVDLAQLAGLSPAGVICEIMNPDGTMARMPDLIKFARRHKLRIISVVDLIKYRFKTERFLRRIETLPFKSAFGDFVLHVYRNELDNTHHLAFVKGDIGGEDPVLLRVHTEAILSDMFLSKRSDEGSELHSAMQLIAKEGRGVVIFLRLQDREERLLQEIREQKGLPAGTVYGENFKDTGIGSQIVADLGLHKVRILTNHPKKMVGLDGYGIDIVEQLPILNEKTASVSS